MSHDSDVVREPGSRTPYSAIVLAGGRSRRFGSDKTRYRIGGLALLDSVLHAVADAADLLVVGDRRPTTIPATWLREDPPGSGPANAVLAALPLVGASQVVLLAADLPFVRRETVARLLTTGGDGGILVDDAGRVQYLCSAMRTAALASAAGGTAGGTRWSGRSMGSLLAGLDLRHVRAVGREAHDVDTHEDVPSDP